MFARDILHESETLQPSILSDGAINWENRLKMQTLLEQSLLIDLNYALSNQAEQTLWNVCFKSCIDFLQSKLHCFKPTSKIAQFSSQDDDAAMVSFLLKTAAGFYTELLCKISFTFGSMKNIVKSQQSLGILESCYNSNNVNRSKVDAENVVYLSQYCLLHLGDISRYRRRLEEAETYYLNASLILPSNGHPFNQLAILESCRNRMLSALHFYTRAIYVKNPFLLSSTNVDKFFASFEPDNNQTFEEINETDYENLFFQLLSMIHTVSNLDDLDLKFNEVAYSLFQAFKNDQIDRHDFVHMIIIVIGMLWRINPTNGPDEVLTSDKLMDLSDDFSPDEKLCIKTLIKLLQHLLQLGFQYNLENSSKFSIGLKILLDFFTLQPSLLGLNGFLTEKCRFLPDFCDFLNLCQADESFEVITTELLLPEDLEFEGFLPFEKLQESLNFKQNDEKIVNYAKQENFRLAKLINHGKWLITSKIINNENLMRFKVLEDEKIVKFLSDIGKDSIEEISAPVKRSKREKPSDQNSDTSSDSDKIKSNKRQSKVSPILLSSMDEKSPNQSDNSTIKDETKKLEQQQPKFKIAPTGSKVDMALKKEKSIEDSEEETESGSLVENPANNTNDTELKKSIDNQSPDIRPYEMPPRFQAAKLKHALSGALGGQDRISMVKHDMSFANLRPIPGTSLTPDFQLPPFNIPSLDSFPNFAVPPPPIPQSRFLAPAEPTRDFEMPNFEPQSPLSNFSAGRFERSPYVISPHEFRQPFPPLMRHAHPMPPEHRFPPRLPYPMRGRFEMMRPPPFARPPFRPPPFDFPMAPRRYYPGAPFLDQTRIHFSPNLPIGSNFGNSNRNGDSWISFAAPNDRIDSVLDCTIDPKNSSTIQKSEEAKRLTSANFVSVDDEGQRFVENEKICTEPPRSQSGEFTLFGDNSSL